ncbi:F-box/kelch-repeat protein At3g06240-like [Salvia miltiorrhiza]|uniref:F-box/kelch-repeat protein At3g06240-like n=1 Tax=Salvia miltiorrhiza TaxID=226208 RepID=UPI0025ABEB65|nr:F-box/kelch-repeat protein At3g06240-like [Salvia miltiorrhiza]XP_057772093.1 F-box/kelch-repeat protein At3g06240-like [Salvia miltiorrhiza]
MATTDLPQEILIDIFSRLPAKSVGKCRCLAKTWRTLLSTPQFIKSHLIRKPHQQNLILIAPSGSVHFAASAAVDGAVSRKLQSPENMIEVAGSCDGLVLLVDEDRKLLVNPITQQQIEITDSPLALTKRESFSMYGLGHDRINDDYKIVALSYWDTDNEHNPDCADTFVDVYSVTRGVWKRVDNSPYDHAVPHLSCGAFVSGAIHWLASSREEGYTSVIAAFDLAREVFDEMPAPSGVDLGKFVFWKLVVLEGCLCLVDAGRDRSDVWIMKEYGVGESWTKLSIEGGCVYDIIKPLCFDGDDEEIVLMTEGESLVVYNVKAKLFRDMVVDGVPAMFVDGGVFVDSLVSPALCEQVM